MSETQMPYEYLSTDQLMDLYVLKVATMVEGGEIDQSEGMRMVLEMQEAVYE